MFFPGVKLDHSSILSFIFLTMFILPAISHSTENENNGNKLLQSCRIAQEYLDNDHMPDEPDTIAAVKLCDDYLTGFREDENIKEIYMQEQYHRGYCFPYNGITNAQLIRVIVNYLQNNHSEQDQSEYAVIRKALEQGYPCNN